MWGIFHLHSLVAAGEIHCPFSRRILDTGTWGSFGDDLGRAVAAAGIWDGAGVDVVAS